MLDAPLEEGARRVLEACRRAGLQLALAEASTGGLMVACLTGIPGASAVLERGVIPYSNACKEQWLGVPTALLGAHGAVSAEVARAMAEGLLARCSADLALAETGVAGPAGGTVAKPVGLVFLAVARRGRDTVVERQVFTGERRQVQRAAALRGFTLLHERVLGGV